MPEDSTPQTESAPRSLEEFRVQERAAQTGDGTDWAGFSGNRQAADNSAGFDGFVSTDKQPAKEDDPLAFDEPEPEEPVEPLNILSAMPEWHAELERNVEKYTGQPLPGGIDLHDLPTLHRTIDRMAHGVDFLDQATAELVEKHPAVESKKFFDEAELMFEAIADDYGEMTATDPRVVAAIYDRLGGDARFAPGFEEKRIQDEIRAAGAGPGLRKPLPEDEDDEDF